MITSCFDTAPEKPDLHLMDLVNYSNAFNQLNICFFYKYMNRETAKLFGFGTNERDGFSNPFLEIAMKYQQESIAGNIQANISNMLNSFNPIKNFSFYNS